MMSVVRMAAKLRGRSLHELRVRAAQAYAAFSERRRWSRRIVEPSAADLARWLGDVLPSDGASVEEALRRHFRTRTTPRFFPGLDAPAETAAAVAARFPDAAARLVARADAARHGRLDLLGFRALDVGRPVDWHLDPVSGRRAPRRHWSRIPYLDAAVAGDHKVVWELNRHQHFLTLGQAYLLTGDEGFAAAIAGQLAHWMDENPPAEGINWASSLEVAFRAMSWTWALHLCRESESLSPALFTRALAFLVLHGRHLETYLSTYFSPNTHLTGEALGLIVLGTMFPELPDAARWRRLGWTTFERHVPAQVSADGVYFEQASHYQRYTVDFLLHALILDQANGGAPRLELRDVLRRLLDHLVYLVRPDGSLPFIGDDDGGRLAPLDDRAIDDCRPALSTGAVLLGDPVLAGAAGGLAEETVWLLGPSAVARFAALGTATPPVLSRAFAGGEGGYGVMRDGWGPGASHLVIDCGPHGALSDGHSHADALAIDLSVRGRPVLMDAGTYSYSEPAERDYFRGAAAHTVVTVDDVPPSLPGTPFRWRRTARARLDRWAAGESFDFFHGSHDGYRFLDERAVVERSVLFLNGRYWVLRDRVRLRGRHRVQLHFHAAPGLEARPEAGAAGAAGGFVLAGDGAPVLRVASLAAGAAPLAARVEHGWVSRAYGARQACAHVVLETAGEGAHDVITFLLPGDAGADARIAELPATGGRAFELLLGDHRDVVLVGGGAAGADGAEDGGPIAGGGLATDAAWAWGRWPRTRDDGGPPAELVTIPTDTRGR